MDIPQKQPDLSMAAWPYAPFPYGAMPAPQSYYSHQDPRPPLERRYADASLNLRSRERREGDGARSYCSNDRRHFDDKQNDRKDDRKEQRSRSRRPASKSAAQLVEDLEWEKETLQEDNSRYRRQRGELKQDNNALRCSVKFSESMK